MVSRYRPVGADDFQLKTHSSYDKLSRLSPSNSHVEPDVLTNLVWIHNFSHGVHSTGLAEPFRWIYSAQGTLDLLLRQTLVELRLWSLEVWFTHASATSGHSTYLYITSEFIFTRSLGSTQNLVIFDFICGNHARALFQISG